MYVCIYIHIHTYICIYMYICIHDARRRDRSLEVLQCGDYKRKSLWGMTPCTVVDILQISAQLLHQPSSQKMQAIRFPEPSANLHSLMTSHTRQH